MHNYSMTFLVKRLINGIRWRTIGETHVAAFYRAKLALAGSGEAYVFPHAPTGLGYVMERVFAELGMRCVASPSSKTVIAFALDDRTINPMHSVDGVKVLNSNCVDISKKRVEAVFHEVFGYNLAIDPLTYQGLGICKSDTNAVHDGQVVQCPVEHIERGKVYERLVNNAADPWSVEDVRLSVIGNQIPVAYLKRRWKEQRFQNTNFQVTLASVDHVISPTEKALILKFSRAMKLDCGELDVLRDRDDNRLYIVDVNKTATGPGRLAFFPKIRAIALMAEAFRQEFLS